MIAKQHDKKEMGKMYRTTKNKFAFAIAVFLIMISCQAISSPDWNYLPDTNDLESIWDMVVDKNGNLWVAAPSQLYRFALDNSKISEFTFNNDGPRSLCVGKSLGVITFEGKVGTYDLDTNSLGNSVLRDDDKYQAAECLMLADNSLLVWKDHYYWIERIFEDKTSSMYYIDQSMEIGDITMDASGKLWALTLDGVVYFQDAAFRWKVKKHLDLDLAPDEIAYRIRWADDRVWIVTDDSLFSFDDSFQDKKLIFNAQTLGVDELTIFDVFGIGENGVMILSTSGIWKLDDESDEMIKTSFPPQLKYINHVAVDSHSGRIYIASWIGRERGIFFLDSPYSP